MQSKLHKNKSNSNNKKKFNSKSREIKKVKEAHG